MSLSVRMDGRPTCIGTRRQLIAWLRAPKPRGRGRPFRRHVVIQWS